MAQIELTEVFWSPVPSSPSVVSIYYRPSDLIDIPANNQLAGVVYIGSDGLFMPPLLITGLDETKDYYIKAISQCNNSVYEQLFVFNELVAEFSYDFSFDFTS